jgi:pimeloyl-[acyl-carrier protein] methyl ester esterase
MRPATSCLIFASSLALGSVACAGRTPAQTQIRLPASAPSPRLFENSRLVVRDRISVEVIGAGPDLVLIPGLASSRETWRSTAERLRGRYRLHIVQVAGFAGEPARGNASGPFFDPVLEDINGYLATLPKPATLIGHSLGGTFGLALAERHPERLSKLLIVDALPFFGVVMAGPNATVEMLRPMAANMLSARASPMPEPQMRAMMTQMVTAPADVDRVSAWSRDSDPAVVRTAMVEDMLADLRPALRSVRTPITVLYETALSALMLSGYAALPNKTLVEVPNSKHFIMYDQPARFATEVDAFLKR